MKKPESTKAIGIMSGTSLDGVDLCFVEFQLPDFQFEIKHAKCYPYPKNWKEKLTHAVQLKSEQLLELDVEYGFYLGKLINKFKEELQIQSVDLIASHGHTIFHNPNKQFTLQIGNAIAITNTCKEVVINDFRTQDVVLGGQGAPLVPIGDELLFSEYDACLNLGGFSNISFHRDGKRIAFDIGFLNVGLNYLAKKLGKEYDKNGGFAKEGKPVNSLFDALNQHAYYQKTPPKSLGIEWCYQHLFPWLESDFSNQNPKDLIRTLTEHCAFQIAQVLNHYDVNNVLLSGGGTYNQFLIEQIQTKTNTKIVIPNPQIIEFKEALIFALLGVLRTKNQPNILSSVTGASKNHCSGQVYFPQ